MRRIAVLLVCLAFALPLLGQAQLTGAGATFPYPIYSKWFSEYSKLHPDVQINYQSIGSGGGINQLKAGTVDFGASDMPLKDDLVKQIPVSFVQLPTVLGSVVPSYNISGVTAELKFTPLALAGIYLGKISKWNDPAIAKANPGVKLPDTGIVVIHRSDGSGTTFVWTDYLSKVSPEWKSSVGSNTSVSWPVGLGGKGNEGVTGMVRQTDGAIGYVELIYALQNKVPFGVVQNAAGNFVKASLESTTSAAAAAKFTPGDFRVSITNAPGKEAYPIASFTYLLIPTHWKDAGKGKIIVDFLHWMLKDGQQMVENLNYAKLPQNLVEMEQATIQKIQ
ncbi:MAG: phosphate ABC transporter substrate-binding protein PstS [Acidobacteriia bacterium]|nr:phosphate ABC transporter substrate-binding protein PstS [Terriglobia bacterium]